MARRGAAIGATRVADALRQSRGLVSVAARNLGCKPQTIYNYLKRSAEVRDAQAEADAAMADTAEGALFKAITLRESWAVQFYLRTKGRARGYGDRVGVELTGAAGGPVRLEVSGFLDALAVAEARVIAASGAGSGPAQDVPDAG